MVNKIVDVAVIVFSVMLFSSAACAAETQAAANDVLITMLEGTAQAYTTGKQPSASLKKGSRVKQNQEVRVGEKSRLELLFPDGTVMRLAEKARLNIGKIAFDKKTE